MGFSLPESRTYALKKANVPVCMLPKEWSLTEFWGDQEKTCLVDIVIEDGTIKSVSPTSENLDSLSELFDLKGRMVWPTLVDMHVHLDKGEVIPRSYPDGTINGAARMNAADYKNWTDEDMLKRMRFSLRCAYVHGVAAIRTHLDHRLNHNPEVSWRVYQILKQEWQDKIELQAVGLTSVALCSSDLGLPYVKLVAENGGILGAVTDGLGVRPGLGTEIDGYLDKYFETAGEYGLDTDLHVDQVPDAFCLPNIAKSVLRTGYKGNVVVDHCVSLALQPESVVNETLELCKHARISFVSLPTPMLYLQDRVKGKTPRWRGVTLLNEIRAAGLLIGLGTDNCRDFWYPYGDHDMVDIFRQAVRIYHLDHPLEDAPGHVGPIPAEIMGLKGVGRVEPGTPANLILFRARNLNEILSRPQSDRVVLQRGKIIEETLPDYSELDPP